MQERHMQLQQQQQPPASLEGSSNGSSSQAALEPAAVLLCGDFNTTPDSDTVRVSSWLCFGNQPACMQLPFAQHRCLSRLSQALGLTVCAVTEATVSLCC